MHSARRGTVAVLLLLFASPLLSQTTKAADPHLVVVRAAKMLDVDHPGGDREWCRIAGLAGPDWVD
jgi:hypothetical protein